MVRKATWLLAASALVGLAFIGQALSQDSRPARGPFDPAAFRAQQAKQMQEALGATDEEFKALQPKIEKVQNLQRDVRGGGMFGMGRGQGRRPRGGDQTQPTPTPAPDAPPQSETQKALAGLTKLLDNKDTKAEDIKTALTAYRDAKAKAKADLEKAQKELKELLTVRQEAVLVTRGLLE